MKRTWIAFIACLIMGVCVGLLVAQAPPGPPKHESQVGRYRLERADIEGQGASSLMYKIDTVTGDVWYSRANSDFRPLRTVSPERNTP